MKRCWYPSPDKVLHAGNVCISDDGRPGIVTAFLTLPSGESYVGVGLDGCMEWSSTEHPRLFARDADGYFAIRHWM
jgi:hypothetical protein